MAILPGTRLGPYEILSAIGAGGMGEVYRARDSKLGRDVALKILPEAFARDPERLARFHREAKVLASLNHPNIAGIYGFEDSSSTHALVMELVEGPTLAERIKAGPIPVDEALRVARQITEALEYAHERGIVHRDLKPANVKVTNDDAVKILDFGLAKAFEADGSSLEIANSPTITGMATQAGVLLGTAAYMSPEQAKGKPVDRRADIWAFGCVLYEMLTAKMVFGRETITDTLAAIIKEEPDWTVLPAETPTRVRVLLQRCLQKDPKQRLRDIGDARISLDEVLSGAAYPSAIATAPVAATTFFGPVGPRSVLLGAGALLLVAVASGLAAWLLKPAPAATARPVTRFSIALQPGQMLTSAGAYMGAELPVLAISHDGTQLAYTAMKNDTYQLYLRPMDRQDSNPIPGTEGATAPFFSPDGRWVGFRSPGKVMKASVSGQAAVTLSDAPLAGGASWGSRGIIALGNNIGAIERVSDAGGTAQPLAPLEKGENYQMGPQFLPGDKAVLFESGTTPTPSIAVQSLVTRDRRTLVPGREPQYAVSGHLLYLKGSTLMAAPFDSQRLSLTGTSSPVEEGVRFYSVSDTGTLVFVPAASALPMERLVWVSRNGSEQILPAPPHSYRQPRISPDGRQIAIGITEQEGQIWRYDLSRDTLSRFTFQGTNNLVPFWTPDGKRIVFTSNKEGQRNLFWQFADGSGGLERLATSESLQIPASWSPDGRLLAFAEQNAQTGYDIWVLRLGDRKAQPFLKTSFNENAPQFSRTDSGLPMPRMNPAVMKSTCSLIQGRVASGKSRPKAAESPSGTATVVNCSIATVRK